MCHYINRLFMLALGILSTVAIANASLDGGFALSQAAYEELNNDLSDYHYSDPKEAIGYLEKLLKEEEVKGEDPFAFNGLRIKALKQIIRLATVADSGHPFCTAAALNLIEQNKYSIEAVDRGSILNLKVNKLTEDLKPIHSLVLHFISEHARICRNVYPEMLEVKLKSLDQSNVNLVEKLFSGVLESQVKKEKERNPKQTDSQAMFRAFIGRHHIPTKQDAPLITEAIKEISKDSKDGANVLVENYLQKPCRYYVEELRSIIEPALHDLRLVSPTVPDKMEFYHSLALFELCTSLI